MANAQKPKKAREKKNPISLDRELESAAEELARDLDPDIVEEVASEVREQMKMELRRRLAEKARHRREDLEGRKAEGEKEEYFVRFSPLFRAQHIVLMVSCILLILTGLPLKFPESLWAQIFFKTMGGVRASGIVHRIGASGLMFVGVFHVFYITLTKEGRREFRQLLPTRKDVLDVVANVRYFLGRAPHGARFGRFSYIEKFDYWAVYWGMVVMITSGLMLWAESTAMAIFPKFFIDMAHEAHSDEALLATLAIVIWHMYNVHLNPDNFPMNRAWLDGKISRTNLIRHHPLEYEEIMSRRAQDERNGRKRRQSARMSPVPDKASRSNTAEEEI